MQNPTQSSTRRPICARIHPEALAHNLALARHAAAGAKIFAVVKANAYGHGIAQVFPALHSADGFAVLELAEAERLRALGWSGPILMLEGFFAASEIAEFLRLRLTAVIHHEAQITALEENADLFARTGQGLEIFCKCNAGMNRLGFAPATYRAAHARLCALHFVSIQAHMMHFACADEAPSADDERIAQPLRAFDAVLKGLGGERSLANSAALLRFAGQRTLLGDITRPGILLYGGSPFGGSPRNDLRPAMSLQSEIIATQNLQSGQSAGYGLCFTARRATRLGIVACGYADGYPRRAGQQSAETPGASILVAAQTAPIAGRVSMDMLAIDLTDVPAADIGSVVTLWGQDAQGRVLSIDTIAQHAGTISYELLSRVSERVPRRL